jgi:D-sedoheptulose 7-phosphate isomerase
MNIIETYLSDLHETIDQIPVEAVENVISILHQARLHGKHIFIMGNGGSASTASHFVCDLAKNTRKQGWPEFRVIGLTDNMAIFSAYGNDEGYENVFCQQLNNLVEKGDIVIGISGSGNSPNVLRAIELANERGAVTVGFTGMTGGKLINLARHVVFIENPRIDQVEDFHLIIEHIICRSLRQMESTSFLKQAEVLETPVKVGVDQETDELVRGFFGNVMPMIKQTGRLGNTQKATSELLSKISQELSTKLDLHNMLSRILAVTVDYVGAAGGSIVVLDEDGEVVDGAMTYAGEIKDQPTELFNETIQHGLAGWVLENRQPALVSDTKEDPRWMSRRWESNLDFSRSAICVPLLTQDRVIGILTLTRLQSNRFTMEDLSLLTSITLALSYSFSSKASKVK